MSESKRCFTLLWILKLAFLKDPLKKNANLSSEFSREENFYLEFLSENKIWNKGGDLAYFEVSVGNELRFSL